MYNKNYVELIGHLTADPEARTTSSGQIASKLRVATNYSYTNSSGERVETAEYHTVDVYGGNAEFANSYLKKGRFVHVEGRLQTRQYGDENNPRWFTSIVGRVDPLDPKPADAAAAPAEPQYVDETIPF